MPRVRSTPIVNKFSDKLYFTVHPENSPSTNNDGTVDVNDGDWYTEEEVNAEHFDVGTDIVEYQRVRVGKTKKPIALPIEWEY